MLPYSPLHLLLLSGQFETLVMTSGNISGLPLVRSSAAALKELAGLADYFLLHNRAIVNRCDDSVAVVVDGEVRLWRRSRGYVPLPVAVPEPGEEVKETAETGHQRLWEREQPVKGFGKLISPNNSNLLVLGAGGDMKNTFCLLRGRQAFLSQHMGEISSTESIKAYRESLARFQRLLEGKPSLTAYDPHPSYAISHLARQMPGYHTSVQHHHAHMAACLAENGYNQEAVGIILDGTGYGEDAHLWGFEILTGGLLAFRRRFHLKYFPLPGGEGAVRRPWAVALSCLLTFCGNSRGKEAAFTLFPGKEKEVKLICRLLSGTTRESRGIVIPLSCGCGRLFDAAAALLGVCLESSYEGQAAAELEAAAWTAAGTIRGADEWLSHDEHYGFELTGEEIDPTELFSGILDDLAGGLPRNMIALKFHRTVVEMTCKAAEIAAWEANLEAVALSGGCWQNRLIFGMAKRALQKKGFLVLSHRSVPPNDGGLSLGQAVIARERFTAGMIH